MKIKLFHKNNIKEDFFCLGINEKKINISKTYDKDIESINKVFYLLIKELLTNLNYQLIQIKRRYNLNNKNIIVEVKKNDCSDCFILECVIEDSLLKNEIFFDFIRDFIYNLKNKNKEENNILYFEREFEF